MTRLYVAGYREADGLEIELLHVGRRQFAQTPIRDRFADVGRDLTAHRVITVREGSDGGRVVSI